MPSAFSPLLASVDQMLEAVPIALGAAACGTALGLVRRARLGAADRNIPPRPAGQNEIDTLLSFPYSLARLGRVLAYDRESSPVAEEVD